MEDFLAEGKPVRKIVEFLRLPVPLPPKLRRAQGPWQELGITKAVGGNFDEGVFQGLTLPQHWVIASRGAFDGLIFDASYIVTIAGLEKMYTFFHERLKDLKKNGRVILISRKTDTKATPETVAAQRSIEGFCRSAAKEIGRRGATANLISLSADLNDEIIIRPRILPVLNFLLSEYSAFISSQVLHIDALAAMPQAVPFAKPLANKTAIITGAARGIGNAIARRMAAEGAKVVLLDRKEEATTLDAFAKELHGAALHMDITSADAPELIRGYATANGGFDIVVHNAGITRDKTLAKMEPAQWEQVLNVNLAAVIRITEALMPDMINENGRIICLSSISGIGGNFGQTNYAASKAGLIGFVQALAQQGGAKGITANAIAPGFIETQMTENIPFFTREAGRRLNTLAQGGLPIDVAEAAVFLASPGSAGISGQTLRVCGGNMMGA
jgi:3-oxoacyl-[acyl-carrier protein] reductase